MRDMKPVVISIVLVFLWAIPAWAQSRRMIALGVGVSADRLNDEGAWDASFDYLVFRIPRPERLGIAWDIGSETNDVTASAVPGYEGSLRMRHVLFGPGYTWRRGRTEVTTSLLAGPSFNRFRLEESSAPALGASAGTSFAIRPDVTCWIDLGPLFGLKLSAHYHIARADLSVETASGTTRARWNARRFRTQIGIVYGIF